MLNFESQKGGELPSEQKAVVITHPIAVCARERYCTSILESLRTDVSKIQRGTLYICREQKAVVITHPMAVCVRVCSPASVYNS